jgi:hypothetical protein
MVGSPTAKRIASELTNLYHTRGFKLEYAEAWTSENSNRVGRDTVSRAVNGRVRNMQSRTAVGLAQFIEHESRGSVRASSLLNAVPQDLTRSSFRRQVVADRDFSGASLTEADFERATIRNCNFKGASANGAAFRGATLSGCTFDHASLVGADFSNSTHTGNSFVFADGSVSAWRSAEIGSSNFKDFRHTGADFRNARMRGVKWLATDYKGGFQGVGADLSGVDWMPHSHALGSEILMRGAGSRPLWKYLAGGVDINARGAGMCWLGVLWFVNNHLPDSERREVWDVLYERGSWGFRWHFKLETHIKWALAESVFGSDYTAWPPLEVLNQTFVGREFTLMGRRFKYSRNLHAVPLGVCSPDEEEVLVKDRLLKNRVEEILYGLYLKNELELNDTIAI